jgi:hypothetical protein
MFLKLAYDDLQSGFFFSLIEQLPTRMMGILVLFFDMYE